MPGAIEFQKMTQQEFAKYNRPQLENYAQAIARNFKRPIRGVRIEARKQVKQILKHGLSTRGHYLFNVIQKRTGQTIGHVWIKVEKENEHAFLYDIVIYRHFRGKSYGKKTLRLIETQLRRMGIKQLGLHVFADNHVAINLYKTRGFRIVSFNMQKAL